MRLATISTALTLLAAASLSHAQAPRYCTNNLLAKSFYSNVISNGKTATIDYYGQFQNMDTKRQTLTVTVLHIAKIGNFPTTNPIDHFELRPYEQKTLTLFRIAVQTPDGTGAPTPADVGKTIQFTCTYKS